MARVVVIKGVFGNDELVYPECPYFEETDDMDMRFYPDGLCTHPRQEFKCCGTGNWVDQDDTNMNCPFDLHKELYGVD
jgi:hypothetical protein